MFDDYGVNSNKLGVAVAKRNEKLCKLLNSVATMNLGDVKDHDIGFDKFDIACEDTLVSPQHWDEESFELIVSNPPYSIKWAGDENPLVINDPRFAPAGVLAPKSKADMAFIMHCLSWLEPTEPQRLFVSPALCTVVEQKRKSGSISLIITSLTA